MLLEGLISDDDALMAVVLVGAGGLSDKSGGWKMMGRKPVRGEDNRSERGGL